VADEGLSHILGQLHRVLDVRITFFDLDGVEDDRVDIKPISSYCRLRRQDPAFAARCLACDRRHLDEAKRRREPLVYHCHDGLVEGVIPIYDRFGGYLGSIMFGQLRPADELPRSSGSKADHHRATLSSLPNDRLADLAGLLQGLTGHIVANALARRSTRPWPEAIAEHIEAHLGQPPAIADLARLIGRSPSFITHAFPRTFGVSYQRYIARRRMLAARSQIRAGIAVKSVAASLGYYDEFHFSRSYKSFWGLAPSMDRPEDAASARP
jgi:AraC-like DNA-binding protein